jgi:ribosomal protein L32E
MKKINSKEVKATYLLRNKVKSEKEFLEKRKKLYEKDETKWRKPIFIY